MFCVAKVKVKFKSSLHYSSFGFLAKRNETLNIVIDTWLHCYHGNCVVIVVIYFHHTLSSCFTLNLIRT